MIAIVVKIGELATPRPACLGDREGRGIVSRDKLEAVIGPLTVEIITGRGLLVDLGDSRDTVRDAVACLAEHVGDVEVLQAIVVVVAPGCRLTRVVHLAEPRIERHIGEGPVTVVPQQGVGMPAEIAKPRTSQDEEVHVAIVVVIGLDDVQASVQTEEPRFGRALREGPVLIVSEEAELPRVSHVDTTMSR